MGPVLICARANCICICDSSLIWLTTRILYHIEVHARGSRATKSRHPVTNESGVAKSNRNGEGGYTTRAYRYQMRTAIVQCQIVFVLPCGDQCDFVGAAVLEGRQSGRHDGNFIVHCRRSHGLVGRARKSFPLLHAPRRVSMFHETLDSSIAAGPWHHR